MVSENPYQRPIQSHWRRLRSLRWTLPFLPQCVIALALLAVITLLYALYLTVGIAAQISGMCGQLMGDARQQLALAEPVEKSAYLVAMAIYGVVFLPFWLVQTPILLLGWLAAGQGWRDVSRRALRRESHAGAAMIARRDESLARPAQWGTVSR